MGGSVALPLVVEVAFGAEPLDTGTLTWTDISDYVRRTSSIDFSRGWDTESDEPLAGRLTFTLNNDSGDFTPGETGTFGEIRNRLPVRVSAVIGTATGNALTYDEGVGWYDMLGATYNDTEIGTVVLWTGLVESWRQSWENGVRSQVQVTCVDRWAAIRRLKISADRVRQLAVTTGAVSYYPFDEAAVPARDAFGALAEATVWSGSSPTLQSIEHPTDPSRSVAEWVGVIGQMFSATVDAPTFSIDTGASVTVFARMSGISGAQSNGLEAGIWTTGGVDGLFAGIGSTLGTLSAFGYTQRGPGASESATATGGSPAQSAWHVVTVTATRSAGTATVKTFLDGVLVDTDSGTFSADWAAGRWGILVRTLGSGSGQGNIAVGGVVVHDRTLAESEALLMSRQVASWSGDTAAVRADQLADFGPVSLSTTGTFTATMSMQDLGDKSLADALMECATAEDGTIYISRDGWPVLTSRSWRVGNSLAFTIPATALAADLTFTLDDQQLTNSATVDRMVRDETAGTVKATADASITLYGEQNKSLQVWLDSDAQHLERANAEANQWSRPLVRSSDLTVDLLTKNATIPASTLLGADIGQRIAISGMPSEAPGATQFFIESIADRVTHTGWERTFTVSPRLDYFTIGDATFGVIDADNVLAF